MGSNRNEDSKSTSDIQCIGLVDADLLDNGTRHPNLVLLKLAGFFYDNGLPFQLILDPQADISRYTKIYLSKVFTFTELPNFYTRAIGTPEEKNSNVEAPDSMRTRLI